MRVAIFGSRSYPDLEQPRAFVSALRDKYPQATVISGGAEGVDTTAEQQAIEVGLEVLSFRPIELEPERFGVEVWHLGISQPFVERLSGIPHDIWGDWVGAVLWRDMLLAEVADRGIAFWHDRSRGTSFTIDRFQAEGKQEALTIYTPESPFA